MYRRLIDPLCRISGRHPYLCLSLAVLMSIPASLEVRNIRLDTNLRRLLPQNSPSVLWSEELSPVVGDGGYFSVLLEGDDHASLVRAIRESAAAIGALPGTQAVEYTQPTEFVDRYRYTLLSSRQLEEILDAAVELQAEYDPLVENLADDGDDDAARRQQERAENVAARWGRQSRFHESADGRVIGMLVRTTESIGNLAGLRDYYGRIESIASEQARQLGLWSGITGSLRNRIIDYDLITSDLRRAGAISFIAVLATLAVSFRSVRVIPVVVAPLAFGLLWAFALVPTLVGDLNMVTSFLLVVLFGMGIDYGIHLVRRFQSELVERDIDEALQETYRSTGRSVLTSGATTALALSVLAISDFRGFSDFGAVGGSSTLVILAAMFLTLPAVLVLGARFGLVAPRAPLARRGGATLVPVWVAGVLLCLVVAASLTAARGLAFDYDFSQTSARPPEVDAIRERHRQVYEGVGAPAVVYVVPDLETLDASLDVLERARAAQAAPTIGEIQSLRDMAPDRRRFAARLELIEEIQDVLTGRWIERVDDPDRRRLIDDFQAFTLPDDPSSFEQVPDEIRRSLVARDGSGALVLSVNTAGGSRDGRMTMAFMDDLDALELPAAVRGPTGERAVLAETLRLVIGEGGTLVGLAFLGIFAIVLAERRSLSETLWVLMPLVAGVLLTLGAMVALGWKLNFFNMVVLPAILGMGVDDGVHYYRRWTELGHDTRRTQSELFEPLTVCSLTTIMGYVGMNMAHHPGLLAIGRLGVLGLVCTWITAVLLLPGLLRLRERSVRAVR